MNCTIVFQGMAIDHFSHCTNLHDAQAYAKARYSQPVFLAHDKMTQDERDAVFAESLRDDEGVKTFTHFGRSFDIAAEFPDTEQGTRDANAFMQATGDTGVLAVVDGRVIVAKLADEGTPIHAQRADEDTVRTRITQRFAQAAQDYEGLIDDEVLALEGWYTVAEDCLRVIAQTEALLLSLPDADECHRDVRNAAARQCSVFYFG